MEVRFDHPMVSVIMPVYNAKEYVEKTIRSVLSQKYTDFELIVIDDGSTDGSEFICRALAKEDCRIRLFRQKNHGICYSRNYALRLAEGKYIAFCDHDDLYEPCYLKNLVEAAEENHADLVKAQYKGIILDGDHVITNSVLDFMDGPCSLQRLLSDYKYFLRTINVLWNGLYVNQIIREYSIQFNEFFKAGWEDNLFNLDYLRHVNMVYGVNKLVYSHIRRTGQSASLGYNSARIKDLMTVYRIEASFLEEQKDLVGGKTYMEHQLRYIDALKTELWYGDCPLTSREKKERIIDFMKARQDFQRMSPYTVLFTLKTMPKKTVKWLLFHFCFPSLLCFYWDFQLIRKRTWR